MDWVVAGPDWAGRLKMGNYMRTGKVLAAMAGTLVVLDLAWLGVIAKPFYDQGLATLRRPDVVVPAAALFYAFYLGATYWQAVRPAPTVSAAAGRGGWLGFTAYTTYELTNWAVLRDWPAWLVPIDVAWGVALTAAVAAVGRKVAASTSDRAPAG